jgi:hypothetical protein
MSTCSDIHEINSVSNKDLYLFAQVWDIKVALATKFCKVKPSIRGPSVRNLLYFIVLASVTILRDRRPPEEHMKHKPRRQCLMQQTKS